MKRSTCGLLVLVLLHCTTVISTEREKLSKDALDAFVNGAKIKETIRVGDSTGRPVAEAVVKVGYEQGSTGKVKVYTGVTDPTGNWTVEGYCSRFANYRITKEGYYRTCFEKHLFSRDYADVNRRISDGRWQPWNPTVDVLLKEKRNPTPLFLVESRRFIVPMDKSAGIDLVAGDLIHPFGKGLTADIFIHISPKISSDGHPGRAHELRIAVPYDDGGLISLLQDIDSQMKSVYNAPKNGYQQTTTFLRSRDNTGSGSMYDMAIAQDEYIVFRIRVEKDERGTITKSRYGKIYRMKFGDEGKDGQTAYVLFDYFLNPTDNDINLEWNGSDLTTGRNYDIEAVLRPQ